MRLNLGCGGYLMGGHVNVDLYAPADVVGDVRELDFEDVDEVVAFHMLEHIPRRDISPLLERIRSWMAPNGRLFVEVPDMEAIMAAGAANPWWVQYVYGSQEHPGEFHQTGFTSDDLMAALAFAGWDKIHIRRFLSTESQRPGMPCLEAEASA